MEDEAQCFEIKRRVPGAPSVDHGLGLGGKVSQVVAAFEAGLTIAQNNVDPSMVIGCENGSSGSNVGLHEEGAELINEYGSNLTELVVDTRKRTLAVVEGEVGSPPTPKKQFVELADDHVKEKVEEASLEWPQADK
ncbi:unnamed protein product [Linum trigynum]|uniref:Uncharacterized protein n=1 Tax=Linum trigynum TaxID=586398 RepID=A0AAV2F6R6_9ROSI